MDIDNFKLSEEQGMILETVRKFAEDQVQPNALEWDEHRTFVRPSFDGLAELGMLGIPMSEASGGADMGVLSLVVALEELGKVCGSSARLLLSQSGLCGLALEGHAAAEGIAMGETLGSFVGPDAKIAASPSGDGFALSGSAPMATAATEADRFVVAATTGDGEALLLLVDPGAVSREAVPSLGFHASAPGMVTFADVSVPADGVVARGDAATRALARVHTVACIGAGAIAFGMGDASRHIAANHAGERIAFGKPLARQQAVALKIADSMRRLEAARHLVYHAARLFDAGREQDARTTANMAKLAACEAAVFAADEAVQILGGYGFTVEYHVERFYRDAKTLEVMDAGAESLRMELVAAAK